MPYFVDINPIAVQLGPIAVHWYGLMYLAGFAGAWWLGQRRRAAGACRSPASSSPISPST